MKRILLPILAISLLLASQSNAHSVALTFSQANGCNYIKNYYASWSGNPDMGPPITTTVIPAGSPCIYDQTVVVDSVNSIYNDRYFQLTADYGDKGQKKSNVYQIIGDKFLPATAGSTKILWIHGQDYSSIAGKLVSVINQPNGSLSEEVITSTDTVNTRTSQDGDVATYKVIIPFSDNWYLWGRTYTVKPENVANANSFWVKFGNNSPQVLSNRRDKLNVWYYGGNGKVESGDQEPISLGFIKQGEYTLKLYDREVTPKPPYFDLFVITNDKTYTPTDADFCRADLNTERENTDGDAIIDICDNCPTDKNKTKPGQCGCGNLDTDSDGDKIADCKDNCPNISNADQLDTDLDKVGDVCDVCPLRADTNPGPCGCDSPDQDKDTIFDCIDNCPTIANEDQKDTDNDGKGDVCDTKQECFEVNYDGSIPQKTLDEILSRPVRDY